MSSNNMEEYYQKVIQLQERLRQSEEERLKLEMKFNEMLQVMKEEEEAHFKKLRTKYKQFLEEDRRRQQRNDKILEALDRIENRTVMWEAKTEKFKALRRKYRNHLKKASNEQRNRSPLDDERTYSDSKYDKQGSTNEKYDYPKRDKSEESDDGDQNGIVEKYLQSLSSTKCKEDILQRKKNLPESKYSNLGNINSICSRTPSNTEKKDTEKVGSFDDDFTQLKTTKDMENALKQNYNKNDDDLSFGNSKNETLRSNDYSYLDFKKNAGDGYDDYTTLQKPSTISDNKTVINKDYRYSDQKPSDKEDLTRIYQKPISEQGSEMQNQVQDSPRQVHNELERLLKEHKDSTSNQPNEHLEKTIPTYSPLHNQSKQVTQSKPLQEQLGSVPKTATSLYNDNNYFTPRSAANQLTQPKEIANQNIVDDNYNTEINRKKSESFENIPQRRSSKMFDVNGQECINVNDYGNEQQQPIAYSPNTPQRRPSKILHLNDPTASQDYGNVQQQPIAYSPNRRPSKMLNLNDPTASQDYGNAQQQPIAYSPNRRQSKMSNLNDPTASQDYGNAQQQPIAYSPNRRPSKMLNSNDQGNPLPTANQEGMNVNNYGNGEQQPIVYKQNMPQRRPSQKFNLNDQQNPLPIVNQEGMDMNNYGNVQQPVGNQNISPRRPSVMSNQSKELGKPLETQVEENEGNVPVSEIPNNIQTTIGEKEYEQPLESNYVNKETAEERPPQENNANQGQPEETVTQYQEETNQYLQQYYDEHGQPLSQYDENGQPLQQYDENGQPVQLYDESGQQMQNYELSGQQYDENGQQLQQYYTDNEHLQSQYYDENGQPLQQYYENSEQHMQGYDENGQPIIQYDANGQPITQYDENGQPIPQYNESGEPLNQYYDENGQPVQYYGEGSQQMYDGNGQPIQDQYSNESYANQQQYYEQQGMEEQEQQQQNTGQKEIAQDSGQIQGEEQPDTIQAKSKVLDILETDTESVKQDTKISNDSDFDLSNA